MVSEKCNAKINYLRSLHPLPHQRCFLLKKFILIRVGVFPLIGGIFILKCLEKKTFFINNALRCCILENTIFKGILCKVDFNLDSRALFLFTEGAAIWALRELRVGIATLKGPVAQNRRKRNILLSPIVIYSKKREKKF